MFIVVLVACDYHQNRDLSGFAEPGSCRKCHEKEYIEWQGSHHDLAMQEASARTVVGDFNNTEFSHFDVISRFYRKGKKFFVKTDGPDGKLTDYEIKYVFGITPLQQYLIEFPGGRLQCLGIAWDTIGRRWFHLYPDEEIPHDDPLHWTRLYQNWNYMCADCHSTDLQKNYEPEAGTYRTTWRQINLGCQSCHGPGQEHNLWAEADARGRPTGYQKAGQMVDMKNSSRRQIEACAPCHSRRTRVSLASWYGKPFYDVFMPALLREPLYHPDGQILDEVYVYASFLQSKMYHAGVRCSDCHNPHSLQVKAPGNALCVRCHQPVADATTALFQDMPLKDYDSEKHHFHTPGTEGARCIDCHMIERNYMVVDPRRDHSFRIPRPDLSLRVGTPNACNDCHADQTPQWSLDWVTKWYGLKDQRPKHYGETIAAARTGRPEALADLLELAADSTQPAIVRATAVELTRQYPGAQTQTTLAKTVQDPEPLVRLASAGCLDRLPPETAVEIGAHLLTDSVHIVRIETARVMAGISRTLFSAQQAIALNRAIEAFLDAQWAIAEQPGAHLNLGVFYENVGQADQAVAAYQRAVQMVPAFVPARMNLARLYNSRGDNDRAEEMLRGALQAAPGQGEIHYSLGLLLGEQSRLDEAETELRKATELLPDRPRVLYNHALALQHTGKRAEAEQALLAAYRLAKNDASIINALVIFYSQDENWPTALSYAEILAQLLPETPAVQDMLEQIRARI
jgi:predicted CXXCH cytochrome family protein